MITKRKDIAVYADGSGMAAEVFIGQRKHLREQHEALELMERFLDRYEEVLWGMRFSCCSVWPHIELWWSHYRGKRIMDAREIARLWPDAEWERSRNEYREHEIDWACTVDGVKLILKHAESTKPTKKPAISGRVDL